MVVLKVLFVVCNEIGGETDDGASVLKQELVHDFRLFLQVTVRCLDGVFYDDVCQKKFVRVGVGVLRCVRGLGCGGCGVACLDGGCVRFCVCGGCFRGVLLLLCLSFHRAFKGDGGMLLAAV